jgi:hypothetical protein
MIVPIPDLAEKRSARKREYAQPGGLKGAVSKIAIVPSKIFAPPASAWTANA